MIVLESLGTCVCFEISCLFKEFRAAYHLLLGLLSLQHCNDKLIIVKRPFRNFSQNLGNIFSQ